MAKTFMFVDGFNQGEIVELAEIDNMGTYHFTNGKSLYKTELHQIKEIPYNPNTQVGIVEQQTRSAKTDGVIDLTTLNYEMDRSSQQFNLDTLRTPSKNHIILTEEDLGVKPAGEPIANYNDLKIRIGDYPMQHINNEDYIGKSNVKQFTPVSEPVDIQKQVDIKLIDKVLKSNVNGESFKTDIKIPSKEVYDMLLKDIDNIEDLLVERIIANLTSDDFKEQIKEYIKNLYGEGDKSKSRKSTKDKG